MTDRRASRDPYPARPPRVSRSDDDVGTTTATTRRSGGAASRPA